jgi:hypothetical protein
MHRSTALNIDRYDMRVDAALGSVVPFRRAASHDETRGSHMADDLRLIQKQLRELLSSNVESLLTHVDDSKLLESSVTRVMGFMRAGDEITGRLVKAEHAIAHFEQQIAVADEKESLQVQLVQWRHYRDDLLGHLRGLTVRLRNI